MQVNRRHVLRVCALGSVGITGCLHGDGETPEEETTEDGEQSDDGDIGNESQDQPEQQEGTTEEREFETGEPYDAEVEIEPTDWSTFGYDRANTGANLDTETPSSLDELWEEPFETEFQVVSSPTVADGVVYFGDGFQTKDGNLYAVDAESGELVWDEPYSVGANVTTAPTLTESTVYFTSEEPTLYALDISTGQKRWSLNLDGRRGGSSPVVVDDMVYAVGDREIHAVGAYNGMVDWKSDIGARIQTTPAYDDGILFVGSSDDSLHAVDTETGEEVWSYGTDRSVESAPTIAEGTVYFGSGDRKVHAVDAETGETVWDEPFETQGWIESSPAFSEGSLYVGSDDQNVYAIDAESGEGIWSFGTDDRVRAAVAVTGIHVYVASDDGNVYAIDRTDGTQVGVSDVHEVTDVAVRTITDAVVTNGTVYVGAGPGVVGLE